MSQGQCYGHPGEDLSQQVHNTAMRPAWSLTLFLIKSVIMKKETIKQIIQIVVTILTAISSTLFVQSCVKSPSSSSIAPQHTAISVSPSKTSGRVITPSFTVDYPDAKILGHRELPNVHKDCPCFLPSKEYKSL